MSDTNSKNNTKPQVNFESKESGELIYNKDADILAKFDLLDDEIKDTEYLEDPIEVESSEIKVRFSEEISYKAEELLLFEEAVEHPASLLTTKSPLYYNPSKIIKDILPINPPEIEFIPMRGKKSKNFINWRNLLIKRNNLLCKNRQKNTMLSLFKFPKCIIHLPRLECNCVSNCMNEILNFDHGCTLYDLNNLYNDTSYIENCNKEISKVDLMCDDKDECSRYRLRDYCKNDLNCINNITNNCEILNLSDNTNLTYQNNTTSSRKSINQFLLLSMLCINLFSYVKNKNNKFISNTFLVAAAGYAAGMAYIKFSY